MASERYILLSVMGATKSAAAKRGTGEAVLDNDAATAQPAKTLTCCHC